MDREQRLRQLWSELQRQPFPADVLDFDDIELHELDTFTAGCISSAVSGGLDDHRRQTLVNCVEELELVMPRLDGANKDLRDVAARRPSRAGKR